MEPMKLTVSQIRTVETIDADKKSYKRTLQIALNFHSNMHHLAVKKERELWREISAIHGLDDDKNWMLKSIEGSVCVIEKVEEVAKKEASDRPK